MIMKKLAILGSAKSCVLEDILKCFNLDRLCFLSLDFNRFSLCCFNLNWLNFFCSYFRGFCFGSFSSSKLQSTDRLPSARCETL